MRVTVLFFGSLQDIVGAREEAVDVSPGTTVGSLFQDYAERFETLRMRRPSILFARNGEFATPDTVLDDRDEVAFLPPVSGGTGTRIEDTRGHFFALTRTAIDVRELVGRVQRDQDGAVVTFEGVVRNNTKGRATSYLDYECYERMALESLTRIGGEIASSHAVGRIGIVHRLGRLAIGEASVVIAVAAPHRKAAFEAAFEAINRLKREVPIWKKEHFADGAVWVDGEWDESLLAQSAGHEPS